MVFLVFAHMFKVFYRGAYRPPREFNWVIGVVLLLMTLLLSYTGYLLPWDQLAYWAITVGSNIASAVQLMGNKMRFLMLGGQRCQRQRPIAFLRAALHDLAADCAVLHCDSLLADSQRRWSLFARQRTRDSAREGCNENGIVKEARSHDRLQRVHRERRLQCEKVTAPDRVHHSPDFRASQG